jgi:TolB-like protein
MKQVITVLLCVVYLQVTSLSWAGEKVRIGVLELRANEVSEGEARALTDRLRTELFQTGRFEVVEREKMTEILQEQGFQQSGVCNTDVCAVEVGKLIGAEQMVAGSVSRIGQTYSVNLRVLDVEQGVMVRTATEDCSCAIDRVLTETIRHVARHLAGITEVPGLTSRRKSPMKWIAVTLLGGGLVSGALLIQSRQSGGSEEKIAGTILVDVLWP